MAMTFILFDSLALVLGSLLVAWMLTFTLWWLADQVHHPYFAVAALLVMLGAVCLSPLRHSLFVCMMVVFGVVGAGLLSLLAQEPDEPADHGHKLR